MNFIDIALSLLFLVVFYFGFNKGIIKQLTNIANIIFSVFFSFLFNKNFSIIIKNYIDLPNFFIPVVAFVVSFILIITSLKLTVYLIEKMVDILHLSFVNKLFGGIFSFVKYLFLLLIPFLFFRGINLKFNFLETNNSFWYSFYENLYNFFVKS
ncbi:MAG: CvpA family protein [Solirubrobacteraceae bacterium]